MIKAKRCSAGNYEYTDPASGVTYWVWQYDTSAIGIVGMWNWCNNETNEAGEPFFTKRECLQSLEQYISGRVYDAEWGWIYQP